MLKHSWKASTLAVLFTIGAAAATPALAQNAAMVNGQSVPSDLLDFFVKREAARMGAAEAPAELREKIRKDLIQQEVLKQEALRKGLNNKKEMKFQLHVMNQAILVNALREDFMSTHKPSEADLKQTYDTIIKQIGGTEYQVSHVLVNTEEAAKAVIEKLNKGGKFAEIAKAESQDPGSANEGGSLGWSAPGTFVPEFAAALTSLKKGEYSKTPVKTEFGYHVLLAQDTREAKPPSFEEVKEQLAQQVVGEKWGEYVKKLMASAKIK
jgi:peptidyl-prolyl cis-trans isomerase C